MGKIKMRNESKISKHDVLKGAESFCYVLKHVRLAEVVMDF